MPTLDDTPVDLVYLGATTACVRVRRGWPADLHGSHPTAMRVTFQDGIQRTFQGDVPFDIAQAGQGGLRQPLAATNSTRYNLFLVPSAAAPSASLAVIGDVTGPTQGPVGYYSNWVYVGSIYRDAGGALIPWFQNGQWFEHWGAVVVENVPALDGALTQVALTTGGGMPVWASSADISSGMVKDAALGEITAMFAQDDGAGAPRAVVEVLYLLDDEAVIQRNVMRAIISLSGGSGTIWRRRVSSGAAVLTEWFVEVRRYLDPYVR